MRAALEAALLTLGWADQTATENRGFTPIVGEAYQRVTFSFNRPRHEETNRSYRQAGWMQVDLMYPAGDAPGVTPGTDLSTTRAELIRAAFWRGRTLEHSGVKTFIDEAPELLQGRPSGDRYQKSVVIRFYANITVSPA